MKKYIILLLSLATIFAFTNCADDVEPGGTATQAMAGDWYVVLADKDGDVIDSDPFLITTYNTAANVPTEMFFDDGGFLKGKVNVNIGGLTFNTSDFVYNYYHKDITFKIYEGKILPKAGHAKSGRVSDSIFVKFEAIDEPGNIYIYSGHRRTGFIEDEY